MQAPNPNQTKTQDCAVCKLVHLNKPKLIKYCDFCGFSNCADCRCKTRLFPVEPNGDPN